MARMLVAVEQTGTPATAVGLTTAANGNSSSGSPTAQAAGNATAQGRGAKLVLWEVALVVPCSELQLWHVLMLHQPPHGSGPSAGAGAGIISGSREGDRTSAGGRVVVQPGMPLQLALAGGVGSKEQQQLLLLQRRRLRSLAAASELHSISSSTANAINTTATRHASSSGSDDWRRGGRSSARPAPLYFRRFVHWGWSGRWITLTCDAPGEGMVPEARDALQQQLDLHMEYGE